MEDKNINNNGFEYVDLGLPSGTLWATCNVGALRSYDYGLYFQWGDTVGYTESQVGTGEGKKKFASDWSDYKFGANPNFIKYATSSITMELQDDAAHGHMGGDWHMPSPDQIQELLNNATSYWATLDDVNGRFFASKKDASKSIFIPVAGAAWDGLAHGSGEAGDIWSSMLDVNIGGGQCFYFSSGNALWSASARSFGLSVRGVIDGNAMKDNTI